VEYLSKRKSEHEKEAVQIDDDEFVDHAVELLINQTVASVHQAGGITAHTVNADTINLHSSVLASGGRGPDWSIQELFRYLRPKLNPSDPTTLWDETGEDVLDKLSTGRLHAWGREIVRGATNTLHSLALIDPRYWRSARFTFAFLLEDHERDLHVTQRTPAALPDYADLRVNREDAIGLWPHPQLGRWNVQSVTLTARYFNHPPDQASLRCKTVALFDAHIETQDDAIGASYSRVASPAYVLITGIDTTAVRSLPWTPQEISFIDLATNSGQQYFLAGMADASSPSGKAKFILEPQAALAPQPISQDSRARALELFSERTLRIHGGIDAPAVLRRGPKLILHVLPSSAFDGRVIDHAAPKLLGHFFVPDVQNLNHVRNAIENLIRISHKRHHTDAFAICDCRRTVRPRSNTPDYEVETTFKGVYDAWIVRGDKGKDVVEVSSRAGSENDLHFPRYLANVASTS
jgi:hypothetical protein